MKLNFSGNRALVMGGSSDLALSLAGAMIPAGIHPLLTYRSDQAKALIEERLTAFSERFDCVFMDMQSQEPQVSLDEVSRSGVDYLVDFAQSDLEGLVASPDRAAVHDYFRTNVAVRTDIVQQVIRTMVAQRKGRMVYVSSVAAVRPNPGQGFYAAAKQASEALYRNVGIEMASRGITTAILRPGYVDAGRGRRYLAKKADVALAKVPLGRALQSEEVAGAIMFLLSDSAMGINATEVTMDGGLSACK